MNIACRFYGLLLLAYPAQFRREFGAEMLQVFRDCYRVEASHGSLPRFWVRTLMDLILTVAKERTDRSGRGDFFMRNRQTSVMAILVCVGTIVIALLLLTYGRRNGVSSIIFFGYFLDALASTGIVGNIIVLLLIKIRKMNSFHAALWSFGAVHVGFLLLITLVLSRSDPAFNLGGVLIGYLMSFLFWTGLHWVWRSRGRDQIAGAA